MKLLYYLLPIFIIIYSSYSMPIVIADDEKIIEKTWGGYSLDVAEDVVVESEGSIFVVGWTASRGRGEEDALLLKYDQYGDLLWAKTWGEFNHDFASAIDISDDNYVYVTGWTNSFVDKEFRDIFLLKYDYDGNLLWSTLWSGNSWDFARGVAVSENGDIYVCGYTQSYTNRGFDILLIKYDSNGNVVSNVIWGGNFDDFCYDIEIHNEYVYLTGYTENAESGKTDGVILKFSTNSDFIWAKTWGDQYPDFFHGLDVSNNDFIYVTGRTENYDYNIRDIVILKFDLNGNLIWEETWGGQKWDFGKEIKVTDNYVYVTGETYSFGSGGFDLLFLKYDIDGELLESKTWGGTGPDIGAAIYTLHDSIYIAGSTGNSLRSLININQTFTDTNDSGAIVSYPKSNKILGEISELPKYVDHESTLVSGKVMNVDGDEKFRNEADIALIIFTSFDTQSNVTSNLNYILVLFLIIFIISIVIIYFFKTKK